MSDNNSEDEIELDVESDFGQKFHVPPPKKSFPKKVYDFTKLVLNLGYSQDQYADAEHYKERIAAQREVTVNDAKLKYIQKQLNKRNPGYQQLGDWAKKDEKENMENKKWHRSVFYFVPVVSPGSRLSIVWFTIISIIDASYVAFGIPVIFVIGFKDSLYGAQFRSVFFEMAIGALYVINVFMELITGLAVVHKFNKVKVMDGKFIAWSYMTRPAFFVDMLSIAPFFAEIICYSTPFKCKYYSAVYVLNLIRLVRVQKTYQLATTHQPPFINVNFYYFLTLIYALGFIINIMAAIWFLLGTVQFYSWFNYALSVKPNMLTEQDNSPLYLLSIYYVLTVMTTIGFGDITAQTTTEVVFTVIFELLGVLTFSILVALISNFLRDQNSKTQVAQEMRTKAMQTQNWFRRYNIHDKVLLNKVQTYYVRYWAKQKEEEGFDVFNDVQGKLREELISIMTENIMAKAQLFRDMEPTNRAKISFRCTPVNLVPYKELVQEGDLVEHIFIVQEGHVIQYVDDNNMKFMKHEAPYVFGFMAVLGYRCEEFSLLKYSNNTYRSGSWCKIWYLSMADLLNLFNSKPHIELDFFQCLKNHLGGSFSNVSKGQAGTGKPLARIMEVIDNHLMDIHAKINHIQQSYQASFNALPNVSYSADGNQIEVNVDRTYNTKKERFYENSKRLHINQNFSQGLLRVSFQRKEDDAMINIRPDLESISMELQRYGIRKKIKDGKARQRHEDSDFGESVRSGSTNLFSDEGSQHRQMSTPVNFSGIGQDSDLGKTKINEHEAGIFPNNDSMDRGSETQGDGQNGSGHGDSNGSTHSQRPAEPQRNRSSVESPFGQNGFKKMKSFMNNRQLFQ